METRIFCQRCGQKISGLIDSEIVCCPLCHELNPNRVIRKRSPSPEHGRITRPRIGYIPVREMLKKILLGGSGNQKSAASGSSFSKNYSKSRALDHTPGPSGKKRAVLCGVSYKKWKYRLKGTINDVLNMKQFLIDIYEFREDDIRVLTEEQSDNRLIPTKANIENYLKWLVTGCRSGDSLVFFYSGHGIRPTDFNDDEADGFDKTICPVDFQESGMILDNDLNSLIVRPLNPGVTLHAIINAYHSGNILDLPHLYCSVEKKWKNNSPPSGVNKSTNGGLAISISACLDNQAAGDTSAFTGQMNGALIDLLAEVLKKLPSPTYGDLFDLFHGTFDNVNGGCLVNTRMLRRIFDYRLPPLLSSSSEFDVYKKHLFM